MAEFQPAEVEVVRDLIESVESCTSVASSSESNATPTRTPPIPSLGFVSQRLRGLVRAPARPHPYRTRLRSSATSSAEGESSGGPCSLSWDPAGFASISRKDRYRILPPPLPPSGLSTHTTPPVAVLQPVVDVMVREDLAPPSGGGQPVNPPINDAIKAANTRLALLIEEADEVVAYQEAEVRPTVLREIRRKANDVITNMRGVISANPLGLDAVLLTRSEEARTSLAAAKLLFDRTLVGTSGGDSSLHDASIQSTGAAASCATALTCARQELDFFLDQLSDEKFIEAGQGAVIPADQLRHVHNVTVPEVSHLIDQCRNAVRRYSAMRGADETVATNALRRCERAYLWSRRVIALFWQEDLHLGSNAPSRDPSFTAFTPGSGTSVYEFFTRFEEWARGYLPADARARILFSKYLDQTILSGHKELETIKGDYAAMKRWLISEYGSVRTVSDMYVQTI